MYNPRAHAPVRVFFSGFLLIWLLLAVLRLVFFVWQWDSFATVDWAVLGKAWWLGLRFDARLAALLSLPLLFAVFWPGLLTPGRKGFAALRPAVGGLYTLFFLLLLIAYAADFGHYAYMGQRVNWAAAEELGDIGEAVRMVWESYPVIWGAIAILAVTWLLRRLFLRCLRGFEVAEGPAWQRGLKWFGCLLLLAVAVMGQLSSNFFPLRWSQAYFSGSLPVTALAINPVQNVYDTRPNRGSGTYEMSIVREGYAEVREFLNLAPEELAEGHSPDLSRVIPGKDSPEAAALPRSQGIQLNTRPGKQPNVVIVIVESLSHHLSSFFAPELNSTPFVRELAAQSLYFPNYYASARTTAKAVFSLLTGIPDANRSFNTSSRDPNVVDQHLIWREFEGYEKIYCIGGNANWANIRGVITNNVPGVRIYEESDWDSPNVDVWGISDHALMVESSAIFAEQAAQNKAFAAVILTAGFHRPFTVPDNVAGFDYSVLDSETLERFGFTGGEAEYRSLRFTDFALRTLIESAKEAGYYNNTVFVIVGDHGVSERSPMAGDNYQGMYLNAFHVPLIIHSPLLSETGVLEQAGGHIDVFPTVAGLLGIPYRNTTLGRDLLDPQYGAERFTFIQRLPNVTLINGREAYSPRLPGQDESIPAWYRHDEPGFRFGGSDWMPESVDAEREERARALALGILETGRWLLYNNSKAAADRL